MKETARLFVDGAWQPAPSSRPDPGACTWIDIELDRAEEAETALTYDWLAGEFPELEATRAAKGGALPPEDPPRIRTFPGWTFSRLYWLGATDRENGDRALAAQETHVLASRRTVVTLRYPPIHWHPFGPTSPEVTPGTPGLSADNLGKHVAELARIADWAPDDFGLGFQIALLGRVASSYINALDFVGAVADRVEEQVSQGQEDADQTSAEILSLRRLLRQIRWAFLPEDESAELLAWPTPDHRNHALDARLIDVGAESVRAQATTHNLMEQVQQTFELQNALRQVAIGRTTYMLTVVATLLLPPTLIAGIYGMNFRYMPWLNSRPAFLLTLGLMGGVAAIGWLAIRRSGTGKPRTP